ncbi:MAG: hypothetical protein WC376_04130 [Candidatus Nanoarchaeia archaeon]|jgi:hypothetical protein
MTSDEMPFFPFPNQDYFWFKNTVDTVHKKIKVKDALFAGGVLYAAMYKGLYPKANVTAIDINPHTILCQSYLIHLIKNNNYNDCLKFLLIDKFDSYSKEVFYSKEEVKKAYDSFAEFIFLKENLKIHQSYFNKIFNLDEKKDVFAKKVSLSDGINLIEEIYKYNIPLKQPDNVYLSDILCHSDSYDFVSTNNIIDWVKQPKDFVEKTSSLLNPKGIIEISLLMGYITKNPKFVKKIQAQPNMKKLKMKNQIYGWVQFSDPKIFPYFEIKPKQLILLQKIEDMQ